MVDEKMEQTIRILEDEADKRAAQMAPGRVSIVKVIGSARQYFSQILRELKQRKEAKENG